jgi:hypothetical protein
MSTAVQTIPTTAPSVNRVIESDLSQRIEDTDLVNAIRNGKLVQVRWNDLTEAEQRQAYHNMFLATNLY